MFWIWPNVILKLNVWLCGIFRNNFLFNFKLNHSGKVAYWRECVPWISVAGDSSWSCGFEISFQIFCKFGATSENYFHHIQEICSIHLLQKPAKFVQKRQWFLFVKQNINKMTFLQSCIVFNFLWKKIWLLYNLRKGRATQCNLSITGISFV